MFEEIFLTDDKRGQYCRVMAEWVIIKDVRHPRNVQAVYNQATRFVALYIAQGYTIDSGEETRYWWHRRQELALDFEKRTGLLLKINSSFRASFND